MSVEELGPLVGDWATEATHPMLPSLVVLGHSSFEWLEGERFLILRARNEHEQFPDSVSILGEFEDGTLEMHYYDSRGVHRIYAMAMDDGAWRLWRDHPGFSQRFAGTFADGGDTLVGTWQLSRDDETWNDDLAITYRKEAPGRASA
jgi:hypothetical protein